MTTRRILLVPGIAAASALALAGCSGAASDDASSSDDAFTIVASTNVYGDIARQIAGDAAAVESIITSSSQDPHEYEASASDQLTIEEADLIIENGGGYDGFVDTMIESTGTDAHVITAAEYSDAWPGESADEEHEDAESDEEHDHEHIEGFNEHVWYSPHTMEHVAEAIADELSEQLPDDADTFAANLEAFTAEIEGLEADLADIDAEYAGAQVFATEPVPGYLVEDAGLVVATPEEFSEAVEEGQDVPAATLLEATQMIESGDIAVLIANTQTGGAETEQVIATAEDNGVPVIQFSEIMPEDLTYSEWMQENIDALAGALAE